MINREYDGWADTPDHPLNLVADANAVAGIVYIHSSYADADLDLSTVPAEDITTTTNSLGGKTTAYLVPTKNLPLVQPLRDIGIPEPVVEAVEKPLRKVVDAGYDRTAPATSQTDPEPSANTASVKVTKPATQPPAQKKPSEAKKARSDAGHNGPRHAQPRGFGGRHRAA